MPTAVDNDRTVDPFSDERNPGDAHYRQRVGNGTKDKPVDNDYVSSGLRDLENYANSGEGDMYTDPLSSNLKASEEKGRLRQFLSRTKTRVIAWGWRVNAAIAGFIALGIFALITFFGLSSFQAIHLAQILALDQTSNIHYTNIRTNNMFRYVLSGGNMGETRVSLLGSIVFSKTVKDLEAIGITFDTNETLGVFKGGVIDLSKFPETRNVPNKDVPRKLVSIFGSQISESDITIRGDKAYIKNLGTGASKALARNATRNLEGGRISYYIKSRQVMKFYNLPTLFHPFRIVDKKITEKIDTREQLIKARKEQKTGRTYESSTRTQAYEEFKNQTTGWRASADGALLIVGATCLARSAADSAITYNREAIVIPQALEAADAMAIGSQQQSGKDFRSDQINIYNSLMTDPDGKSIWDAKGLQAKTNPTNTKGESMPDTYDQAFNSSTGATTLRDLGGTAGAAACSTTGQVTQVVLGGLLVALSLPTSGGSAFAYGALKAAGGAAVSVAIMGALHELISASLEDNPIPDNVSAPVRGNLLAYGSRELANINARASGGIELSKQESSSIDTQIALQNQQEFTVNSSFAQFFNINDHRSILSKVVAHIGSPEQASLKLVSGLRNFGTILTSAFGNMLPSAQAATSFDYGFNRYGIPERILNNPDYDDPYKNADLVAALLNSDQGDSYIERADKCFGVTISKDSDGLWGSEAKRDINPLSAEYEEGNCDDANDTNWDRIILFVNDNSSLDAAACYLGQQEACVRVGAISQQAVCSIESSVGMPSWVKMPVVNARVGGPVSGNITMAIANIKEGKDVANGLRIMAERNLDFIGLNEVGETSLEDMESAIPAYGAFRERQRDPDDGGQSLNNAIMWRKDTWNFLDGGRIKITDKDNTFASGQPRTWNRYAVWAVFERKSDGAVVPVIVTHAMTNPAKYPRQHGNPTMTRIEQYSLSMDILIQLSAQLSKYGPVLIAGDMNSHDNQGDWSAVSKLESIGYSYSHDGAVVYIFNPKGTKVIDSQILTNVKTPGDSHPGAVLSKISMNGAGPGSIEGVPASTLTSSNDCPDTSADGGVATPGSVKMEDDYARECGKYTSCTGQCVDFVKFRLKKYIDASKFNDFTTGTGGVSAYTSSENLGKKYGYKVDNTPAVNAVVSWPAGGVPGSGANDTYGHVAMVSKVNADGSIVVEEYNATTPAETYSTRTIPANAARLLTYAHTEVDFK